MQKKKIIFILTLGIMLGVFMGSAAVSLLNVIMARP